MRDVFNNYLLTHVYQLLVSLLFFIDMSYNYWVLISLTCQIASPRLEIKLLVFDYRYQQSINWYNK